MHLAGGAGGGQAVCRQAGIFILACTVSEEAIAAQLLQAGLHRRTATQFHWFNEVYTCFEDFLAALPAASAKLRRERAWWSGPDPEDPLRR